MSACKHDWGRFGQNYRTHQVLMPRLAGNEDWGHAWFMTVMDEGFALYTDSWDFGEQLFSCIGVLCQCDLPKYFLPCTVSSCDGICLAAAASLHWCVRVLVCQFIMLNVMNRSRPLLLLPFINIFSLPPLPSDISMSYSMKFELLWRHETSWFIWRH